MKTDFFWVLASPFILSHPLLQDDTVVAEQEAPSPAPPEDPEIVALKEEIANQESLLKAKRSELSRLQEDADKYSSSGYARRVAQMEDMKRIRLVRIDCILYMCVCDSFLLLMLSLSSPTQYHHFTICILHYHQSMQSTNKDTSVASVLTNFIPVLDDLRALKAEYDTDEFGSKYSGLAGAMMASLKELGVEEYSYSVGDVAVAERVSVVDEEYSTEVPKGSVIRPVSMGMDLSGNVMRLAQVVVSLGDEAAAASGDAPAPSAGVAPMPDGPEPL